MRLSYRGDHSFPAPSSKWGHHTVSLLPVFPKFLQKMKPQWVNEHLEDGEA